MSVGSRLTHVDDGGAATMVAISDKPETPRSAEARARVRTTAATLEAVERARVAKGDVIAVARLAAVSAAKATSTLIPLCHPVRITAVDVTVEPVREPPGLSIRVRVEAVDRTGPDMEAMVGAAAAALAVYDMCKAMDRAMTIEAVELVSKTGGASGTWRRPA